MSFKVVQHLTHTSNLPYMDFMRLKQGVVIERKVNDQAGGPLNIEQPVVVLKEELKKNRNYDIPSHMLGSLFNQKHVCVFGKTVTGVTLDILKSNHKKFILDISLHKFPQADETDLVTGGIVMRNHHFIHMSVSEESQKFNQRN